jgi:hypothetical protein
MKGLLLTLVLLLAVPCRAVITRTAKGTAQEKTSDNSITLAAVTIAAGAHVMAMAATTLTPDPGSASATWNGIAMTRDLTQAGDGNSFLTVFSLYSAAGGTGDVVVTWTSDTTAKVLAVTQIAGLLAGTAIAFDVAGGGDGTSTSPDSGTVAPGYDGEIYWGAVATNGPSGDTAGTWSNGYSNGQRDGTTGGTDDSNITISEGFLIVTVVGTARAQKTGITSRDWAAGISTYIAADCGANYILWVTEDVAANTVGVFNDPLQPFGIQQAFRSVCQNANIHIVAGANNYDSTSTSWTGRDNLPIDATINVDTVSGQASPLRTINIIGYADTSTPCDVDVNGNPISGCPVTLDFDQTVTTGDLAMGFRIDMDYYTWQWIRATDADFGGFVQIGDNHVFFRCRADHNARAAIGPAPGFSIGTGGTMNAIISSQADSNYGHGFETGGQILIAYSKAFDNASGSSSTSRGIDCTNNCTLVGNAVWNNLGDGVNTSGAGAMLINNTIRLNGGVGYDGSNGNFSLFNIFTENTGGGWQSNRSLINLGNNYGNNTPPNVTAIAVPPTSIIDVDGVVAGTMDLSTVTFASTTNPTPTGGTADITFFYSPVTPFISQFQQGAIQVRSCAPGGSGCCWIR